MLIKIRLQKRLFVLVLALSLSAVLLSCGSKDDAPGPVLVQGVEVREIGYDGFKVIWDSTTNTGSSFIVSVFRDSAGTSLVDRIETLEGNALIEKLQEETKYYYTVQVKGQLRTTPQSVVTEKALSFINLDQVKILNFSKDSVSNRFFADEKGKIVSDTISRRYYIKVYFKNEYALNDGIDKLQVEISTPSQNVINFVSTPITIFRDDNNNQFELVPKLETFYAFGEEFSSGTVIPSNLAGYTFAVDVKPFILRGTKITFDVQMMRENKEKVTSFELEVE